MKQSHKKSRSSAGDPEGSRVNFITQFGQRLPVERMSWHAYNFDNYKYSRNSFAAPDLSSIRCPSQRGLVSIVLPVYNGEKYIRGALDSILEQTYQNFELLVVDDGSTDETPQILNNYATKEPRLQVLRQQNQRLPRALNNGFKLARGEYLTWISADNRMKPDFLETLVNSLNHHPDWDMAYANIDIIDENGVPMRNSSWYKGYQLPPGSEHVKLPTDTSELNVWANNYVGSAFLYRDRAACLVGNYSPYRFGMEDYDYWMRVNALLNLHHVEFTESIYDYRFHSDSLTSRDDELGITRDRIYLMTFENFRRDFYLTPLAWIVENTNEPGARSLAQKIKSWVSAANHIIFDEPPANTQDLYRLWFPKVYLKVVDQPHQSLHPPSNLPAGCLTVLVTNSKPPLPASMDPSWNVCITIEKIADPLPLENPTLGWMSIPHIETLCTAIDIQTRSAHLAMIEGEIQHPPAPQFKISVVICTYQRGELLKETIKSVARQTFPAADYEVIVVNNDPQDTDVDEMVAQLRRTEFKQRPRPLRLINCPFKGLSFARNAGISEAKGEVISFIDDDAVALPDWLEKVWHNFEHKDQVGVVGGTITLDVPHPRPRWLKPGWEKFWSQFTPDFSDSTSVSKWWEYPWGANWNARRKALLEIGGFRSNYGRRGKNFGGSEETVAAALIHKLGYEIVIAPAAKVTHNPKVDRYTFKHIWNTIHASKLNEYSMQTDLYISTAPGIISIMRNLARNITVAFTKKNLYLHQRFEHLIYVWFDLGNFGRLALDHIRKFRRPYNTKSASR